MYDFVHCYTVCDLRYVVSRSTYSKPYDSNVTQIRLDFFLFLRKDITCLAELPTTMKKRGSFLMLLSLFFLGAKFKKYVGYSAHVTNVRFMCDKHHVISVGGADNAIFQWKFISAGEEGPAEDGSGQVGGDSDSEESNSDLSDVGALDSDVEKEQERTYER